MLFTGAKDVAQQNNKYVVILTLCYADFLHHLLFRHEDWVHKQVLLGGSQKSNREPTLYQAVLHAEVKKQHEEGLDLMNTDRICILTFKQ